VLKDDPGEAEDHRQKHRQLDSDQRAEVGACFAPDRDEAVVHFPLEPIHPPLKAIHPPFKAFDLLIVRQSLQGSMEAPSVADFKRRYRSV
jgi:hypothetical protein